MNFLEPITEPVASVQLPWRRVRVTIRTTKPWHHPGFVICGLSDMFKGCTTITREYGTRETAGDIRDAAESKDDGLEFLEVRPV